MALKLLVVGDVAGHIDTLMAKAASVHRSKNGPFDALICTGSFFGEDGSVDASWAKYLSRELAVPLPTYILGPVTEAQCRHYATVPEGGDLCPNLTYLGRAGVTTIAGGLRVAVLSGSYEAQHYNADSTAAVRHYYIVSDVDKVLAQAGDSADLLLSSRWPDAVFRNNPTPPSNAAWLRQNPGVTTVAQRIKPRYHLAGGQVFFERMPYRNHEEGQSPTNVTRFIGLAPVGNPEKEKWIYAFNIKPRHTCDAMELVQQPEGTTASPFANLPKRPAGETNFFFSVGGGGAKRQQDRRGSAAKRPPVSTADCWFCLASPKVEKHLVVSVGKDVYIVLPKGPLNDGHVLITPVQHVASTVTLDSAAAQEVKAYKAALRKCFAAQDLDCVFFERNYKSDHMQLQGVPVPKGSEAEVEKAFRACAKQHGLNLDEQPKNTDLTELFEDTTPYFTAELPSGRLLVHGITGMFPMQFGREALCLLFKTPHKLDWKKCLLTKEEETADAAALRQRFKPFDIHARK